MSGVCACSGRDSYDSIDVRLVLASGRLEGDLLPPSNVLHTRRCDITYIPPLTHGTSRKQSPRRPITGSLSD
ncbi:hypothetical protein BD310DRAFT_939979, partial [Dichomitus squalens]